MAMVWLNGGLQQAEHAHLMVSERGFLLGDGLFETIRLHKGAPCWWADHRHRLAAGCAVLGLSEPDWDQITTQAIPALVAAEGLESGSLRLTWTRGSGGPRGVLPGGSEVPTMLISASGHAVPSGLTLPGLRLITASVTRRNEFSPLSRLKSLNYGDGILARQQAAAAGADDAVLLNTQGRVAETTIASLFALVNGHWVTPPVSEGALPGIRRAQILAAGLAVEAVVSVEDLASAEALVVTNALSVRAVASCDDRALSMAPLADWASRELFL